MLNETDILHLFEEIHTLAAKLPHAPSDYHKLSDTKRRQLRTSLENTIRKLDAARLHLDPISLPDLVFDPTAPKVVGKLVADTLLLQPRVRLDKTSESRFYGAGVYALYYRGSFDCYRPISGSEHPIYVGKADPIELHAANPREQGERLSSRLKDHTRSIRGTNNLDITDFDCRYLVVRSAWVETAEDHLIEHFKPVWNKEIKVCQGFGKHGDDPNTRANKRSPWDTLHPGRKWATRTDNTPGSLGVDQVKTAILKHFSAYPPVV
ncbi:MAG: Eco29kI family restriction endonuclease [Verrucomicrobiota bacterium]